MHILGIDIGGSGIKGAPVDTETGKLLTERFRIPTPQPATPEAVLTTVTEVLRHFAWQGPVGCGFPSVVQQGIVRTAANIDPVWIGFNIDRRLGQQLARPVHVINDADAAGLAEMRFGAGQGHAGVVLMVTLGTGIGTALFNNGALVPNTELGHIEIRGKEAERRAADSVRELKGLTWARWAKRVDEYLHAIHRLLWPDLIILGGGASQEAARWVPYLTVKVPVVVAHLQNQAGIAGAALAALETKVAAQTEAPKQGGV